MKRGLLFVIVALIAGPALGCGYCIEDKIAAAYDHAAVTQTLARGHDVAFVAYEVRAPHEVRAPRGRHDEAAIRGAIESIAGVDRGSVRVAAASESLSVAFDPKRLSPGKFLAALDRKLAPLGVEPTLLRFGNPAAPASTPR